MDVKNKNKQTRLLFEIPTRGLLGYRSEFVVDTKGNGILCTHFLGFRPYAGDVVTSALGAMISMASGKALSYSLWNLQDRGTLYIGPGTSVYEGMIVGNTSKGYDMDVTPIKGKHLTNVRASSSDDPIYLTPSWELTIEKGLSIMNDDEYLEVTPKNIRLRKQLLTILERKKAKKVVE